MAGRLGPIPPNRAAAFKRRKRGGARRPPYDSLRGRLPRRRHAALPTVPRAPRAAGLAPARLEIPRRIVIWIWPGRLPLPYTGNADDPLAPGASIA